MQAEHLTYIIVPLVLWGLVGLSVLSWALFVLKLIQFGRVAALNRRFTKQFWNAGSMGNGEDVAGRSKGPKANTAKAGFNVIHGRDLAMGETDLAHQVDRGERLDRSLRQQVDRERRSLEAWLVVLASLGSTAPFIGLFGTVWGIMGALVNIGESGSTGLQAVAGPVGHALIATALGIAVAVPAVIMYNFLVRRMKNSLQSMNDYAHDFYSMCQQNDFQPQDELEQSRSGFGEDTSVGQRTHATA